MTGRPLIISDCDEVLLHMVVPFRQWLDEAHDIHFEFTGGFVDALRHKGSGDIVDRQAVWPLLEGFFETEMHRQLPIAGAAQGMARLAERADILILTNIGDTFEAARQEQVRAVGIDYRVIGNRGGKGEPLAKLIADYDPSIAVFIDDLGDQHSSVAAYAPHCWRLQLVGEPELAPIIPASPHAHARIDQWADAVEWIETLLDCGVPPPTDRASLDRPADASA